MPFARDHVSIVKPADERDDLYGWLKARLVGYVRRRGPVTWDGAQLLES